MPASFIEYIHDVLVGIFLPFDEKVNPSERRDIASIESALGRPNQTAFGVDVWPHLAQKAAALFYSLVCNHCFINGNKRTAVIALDIFLITHQHILTLSSDEVYEMAKATAQANQEGRAHYEYMAELGEKISGNIIDARIFSDPNMKALLGVNYDRFVQHRDRAVGLAIGVLKAYAETEIAKQNVVNEDELR